MAIGLVGTQTGALVLTTSTLVNFALSGGEVGFAGSTPQAGDLVVVEVNDGTTVNRNPAATGYSQIGATQYQNDSVDSDQFVGYKFMGSTPDTGVTITASSAVSSNARNYHIRVYRGVDPTTPLDVAAVQGGAINTSLPNPGAITPATSQARIVVFGAGAISASGFTSGYATPADLSNFVTIAGMSSTSIGAASGSGDKVWTSGAFDPVAWTNPGRAANTADSNTWTVLALRPAAEAVSPATGGGSGDLPMDGSGAGTAPATGGASGDLGLDGSGVGSGPARYVTFDGTNDNLVVTGLTNTEAGYFRAEFTIKPKDTNVPDAIMMFGWGVGSYNQIWRDSSGQLRIDLPAWGFGTVYTSAGAFFTVGDSYDFLIEMDPAGTSIGGGVTFRLTVNGAVIYSTTGAVGNLPLNTLAFFNAPYDVGGPRFAMDTNKLILTVAGTQLINLYNADAATWNASPYMVGAVSDVSGGPATGGGGGDLPLDGSGSGTAPVAGGGGGDFGLDGSGAGTAPATGGGSGSLGLDGVGSGTAPVAGGASGSLDLDGSGSGVVPVAGEGGGELPLDGSGSGAVPGLAAGGGDLPLDGSGAGVAPGTATGAGDLPLDGSAQGTAPVSGTGGGELPADGSGSGTAPVAGGGSGTLDLDGSGAGTARVVGTGAGDLPLDGSGTGDADPGAVGAGGGELPLDGSGAGAAQVAGTGEGSLDLDGSGSGTAPVAGTGGGELPLDGFGSSEQLPATGTGGGELPLDGFGSGTAPVAGEGGGALPLDGASLGTAPVAGAGNGALGLDGSGAGGVPVAGEGAGDLPLGGVGGGRAPSLGTGGGSLDLDGAGAGEVTDPPTEVVWADLLPEAGGGWIALPVGASWATLPPESPWITLSGAAA